MKGWQQGKGLGFGLMMMLALGACASMDTASRAADPQGLSLAAPGQSGAEAPRAQIALRPRFDVTEVRVTVPETLRVSEANVFFPIADIVWRGEPRGNRHSQVRAILEDGAGIAVAKRQTGAEAGPAAVLDLTVTRFHGLTEKTRYTVGGVHALHFTLVVRDVATGRVLDGPRAVVADVRASGGSAAIAEDAAGRTQRVVIVERLAEVIRRELSTPVAVPAATPVSRDVVAAPLSLSFVADPAASTRFDSLLRLTPRAALR